MTTNNNFNIQSLSLNTNKFFQYMNGYSVRTYTDANNNSWFVAKDIAEILEYKDTRKAIADNVSDKHKCRLESKVGVASPYLNQQPNTVLINEAGLYQLMFRSKKKEAEIFTDWVTEEVLPALRKTGEYKVPTQRNAITEQLENISKTTELLTRLGKDGQLEERDRLLMKDRLLNITMSSSSDEVTKSNIEWSLSKRLSEVYYLSGTKFNRMCITFGGKVAKKYKEIHNESPPKRNQFVDGTIRNVNCYYRKDYEEFIDEMIEDEFKDYIQFEEEEE